MTRINIDLSRCEGHGRCMAQAPEVYGYDDLTSQAFVLDGADLEANRDAIETTIEACPEGAISWTEDEG